MSQTSSISAKRRYGLARICLYWRVSRATLHRHLSAANRVFEDERRLHPELADRLPVAPDVEVRRCRDEALAADRILAPSDYVRATLVDIGVDPAKIELLPYGADTSAFGRDSEPAAPPFRILFAGHIAPRKGILYLLDAMRRLGRDDAELVLLGRIEGDGAWLAPYDGEYTHVPHLPHGEIPAVFRDQRKERPSSEVSGLSSPNSWVIPRRVVRRSSESARVEFHS